MPHDELNLVSIVRRSSVPWKNLWVISMVLSLEGSFHQNSTIKSARRSARFALS